MGKSPHFETVDIDKLVHGGQGFGTLIDGTKAFVWNSLPGERVVFEVTKRRRDYIEGVATEIISPADCRIDPKDNLYLSTSPWQIIDPSDEDSFKHGILTETFNRAHLRTLPLVKSVKTNAFWNYRNKMEYSFYGDDSGLHLALFNRGTKSKAIVSGSSLAMRCIDRAANELLEILNSINARAGDLKSVVLRANQQNHVAAALFTRNSDFPKIKSLPESLKGLAVVYSNPKSPASVRTEDLYILGDISLMDKIAGVSVHYDAFSFFQVNVSVFENAVTEIAEFLRGASSIDFYSGVGSIGLAIPDAEILVENDDNNVMWAKKNALQRKNIAVIHAKSEDALDYIDSAHSLIVDPPRAGLHSKVIDRILQNIPPKIAYLSCNPSTQARDLALLQGSYEISSLTCYNFFPRTPHIESLALLVRK